MSNNNLGCFIFFWIAFTTVNLKICALDPERAFAAREEAKATAVSRQDEVQYSNLLTKIKGDTCSSTTDAEHNTFYKCSDGTTVSTIKWTRGNDRKGVVTRMYDAKGELKLIYGHPDDVY